MSQDVYKTRYGIQVHHNGDTFDSRPRELSLLIRKIKSRTNINIKDSTTGHVIERNATNAEKPEILKALEKSLDLTNKTLINMKKNKKS